MTPTTVPTSQGLEWSKLFPRHVTERYTSSATFMKQLTVVAISTITYLKNAFPEDNYTEDVFGGVKIMVLKNKCTDELAQFLMTALSHAFEAFDKKYLHQIALCFYENDCQLENIVEYHTFQFTYTKEGVSLSIRSKSPGQDGDSVKCTMNDIKEQAVLLLRSCMIILSTSCLQLPEIYDVSLRLYYNEDAPEGYQAPGFLAARQTDDPIGVTYDQTVKIGMVQTPFHGLIARTYAKNSLEASREAIPSQNPPVMTQAAEEEPDSDRSSPTGIVNCSCNCVDWDAQMLTCQYCNTKQHAVCYGLLRAAAARLTRHCCVVCASADASRRPTDTDLAAVGNTVCFAIFRRALAMCARAGPVRVRELQQRLRLGAAGATKLLQVLRAKGVLVDEPRLDSETPIKICQDRLYSVMKRYFRVDEEDIVDRLVEETFASRKATDPVGDILGPLEKVSLQNASKIGRVIERDVDNNNPEDPTLKQYREALIMEKLDDLPFMSSQESLKEFESKATKRKAEGKENKKAGVLTKKRRSSGNSAVISKAK